MLSGVSGCALCLCTLTSLQGGYISANKANWTNFRPHAAPGCGQRWNGLKLCPRGQCHAAFSGSSSRMPEWAVFFFRERSKRTSTQDTQDHKTITQPDLHCSKVPNSTHYQIFIFHPRQTHMIPKKLCSWGSQTWPSKVQIWFLKKDKSQEQLAISKCLFCLQLTIKSNGTVCLQTEAAPTFDSNL